ncbi:hypothetical protein O181_000851 [Austropuccinia psidii MF-1]|uniref:Uncharacterized protein n=1 Tax=Austropuccinia psidii MF-1 TaxID=1389203 RepID=A0A9Q3B9V3_9BASI|nr:hypothetical protein [Austropuccinia psidii MF-1]
MSGSTHLKKAANNKSDAKPLSNKEVFSLLNSLQSELSSLKSSWLTNAAKMQSLHLELSPPPPTLSPLQQLHVNSLAYNRFMQEPYRAANWLNHLQRDGSNFAEWVAGINRVLCIALNSEFSVNDSLSLLENRPLQENRAISHFINTTLPPHFALCIGVVPSCTTPKEFFDTIKTRCFLGNHSQKLKVVRNLLGILDNQDQTGRLSLHSKNLFPCSRSWGLRQTNSKVSWHMLCVTPHLPLISLSPL